MDTSRKNDWRLERWIAVLLSLLYLLPFVARGESFPPHEGAGLHLLSTDDGSWQPAVTLSSQWSVDVSGPVARGRLVQSFRNESSSCVEGTYVLPLPPDAAVDELTITIGDRRIEGVIRARQQARNEYETARSEGRRAALLEQFRPDVFRISIASILPGEEAIVETSWQQPVAMDARGGSLRIPTIVAPRFRPPASHGPAVPEQARLPNMVLSGDNEDAPAAIEVNLAGGLPLAEITSPSHPSITTNSSGPGVWRISTSVSRANREFVLRWRFLPGSEPQPSVLTADWGGEKWTLVTIVPPASATAAPPRPRELVIVLDTSGSMHGPAIEQAKAAVRMALDRLTPLDRLQIVTFSDRYTTLFPRSETATPDVVDRARSFVAGLVAEGGTMMHEPLQYALTSDDGTDTVRQIVFVTDGQVGNEHEILAFARQRAGRSRIYTIALGPAPNSWFLRALARFGRGSFSSITDLSEVRDGMTEAMRKLEHPMLTDVEIAGVPAEAEMIPNRIGDLHDGDPITVAIRGEVRNLTVRGRRGDGAWTSPPATPVHVTDGASLARLWARRRLELLEDSIISGADAAEVTAMATRTAVEFGLLSSYTSLVAVDQTPEAARVSCDPAVVASAAPDGWKGTLPQTATWWQWMVLGAACLVTAGFRLLWRS